MNKTIGSMNIPVSEVYNEEDDVYYVTFKTGEPSYCEEVNDVLIVELGLFTNLPTGFRILNFKKNQVKHVGIRTLLKDLKNAINEIDRPTLHDREAQVKRALEEVLS